MTTKSNLDFLRSLAVTLVVVDHTFLAKGLHRWGHFYIGDTGLFGVYLFFLHTSLVLMWSLERRPNTLDFYIRRIFRLYPLAIIAICFAAATHAPTAGYGEHYFYAATVSAPQLLVNCLLLQDIGGRYFIIHSVTWSLSLEVYMYLLLPALFFYARAVRKRWPFILLWLLAVLLARRLFELNVVGNNLPTVIPDFVSGVIAYVGFMRAKPLLPAWTFLPVLGVLFCAYMSFHQYRADWFACLALALILPYIRQFEWKPGRIITHTIAKYSYGVYLFHPFSIVLGMYLMVGRPLAQQLAAEFSTLIIAAVLAYHAVEFPMIQIGARVAARLAHERGMPSEKSLEDLEPAP